MLIAVAGFCAFAIGLRKLSRSQSATYYLVRKQEHDTAIGRLRSALAVMAVGAAVFVLSRFLSPADAVLSEAFDPVWQSVVPRATAIPTRAPQPRATDVPSVTPPGATPTTVPAPSATPTTMASPTASSTPVPSRTPTATGTGQAKATSTPEVVPSAPPTERAQITATRPARSLRLNALAAAYDAQGKPFAPTTEFPAGTKVLFVFFDYAALPADIQIQHVWMRNGQPPTVQRAIWPKAGDGTGYLSLQQPNGFETGLWEVRVFLEDKPQFVANFVVK